MGRHRRVAGGETVPFDAGDGPVSGDYAVATRAGIETDSSGATVD